MFESLLFGLFLLILTLVCVSSCNDRKRRERHQRTVSHRRSRQTYNPSQAVVKQPIHRRWEPSQRKVDIRICTCGKWNTALQSYCWSCNKLLRGATETITFDTARTCSVCSYWIYPGERVMLCPACHTQGHRAHLFEFVKAKGTCPKCNRRLNPNTLLDTQPVDNHIFDFTS